MIKLALTDLDDTLIPAGTAPASDRALAAMRTAMAAGVHCGPVTGRAPSLLPWLMGEGTEDCWATGAFANGQIVRLDGRTIREVSLPRKGLERLVEVLDGIDGAWLMTHDAWSTDYSRFVTTRPDALRAASPERYQPDVPVTRELPETEVVKANIVFSCGSEGWTPARDALNDAVPELDFVFPGQGVPVLDITPRGWDKGKGVLCLAEALGIGPDEVAVFGDSQNDLSMLAAVPNSVAVANATPEVRAAARWHIGASADGALPDALEEIARAFAEARMPSFMTEA